MLADYYPDVHVVVASGDGPQVVRVGDLLLHTYRWQTQQIQRLRSRANTCPPSVTGASG